MGINFNPREQISKGKGKKDTRERSGLFKLNTD